MDGRWCCVMPREGFEMVVRESGVLEVGGRLRRGMGGRALRVLDGLLLALSRMLWPGLKEIFIGYPSIFLSTYNSFERIMKPRIRLHSCCD
jgi:hypothetical protein